MKIEEINENEMESRGECSRQHSDELDFEENGWINSLDGLCQSVREVSPGHQALIGGLSGCTVGYFGMKVGRFVAFTIGCTLLAVQVASYRGYTPVNWKKVGGNAVAIRYMSKRTDDGSSSKQVQRFVENNSNLAGGFVTGLLFGASLS